LLDQEGQAGTAQNQTPPIEFKFENHTLRTVVKNGDIWFVASDACAALGLSEPHKALVRLDEDEKGGTAIPTPGGSQEVNIINESGLYNLIFTSRKPRAKAFRRWVTTAVLPSIRKTGRYDTKQDEPPPRLASSDDNVFVRVPRSPASTPFAHYIVIVTPEGSNVVEPSDFDPISAQRTRLDLRLLAHRMLAVEILWIKARLLIPELSYRFPSLEGFHSAILDTAALANEIT
jgi:prophage antirepressor-like protein